MDLTNKTTGLDLILAKRKQRKPYEIFDISCQSSSFFGHNISAFEELDFNSGIHPDDVNNLFNNIEKAIAEDGQYAVIYRFLTGSKGYLNILEKGITDNENGSFRIMLTELPIEQPKQTNKYIEVFNEISEAVLIHKNHIIQDLNKSFCEIFGCKKEDLIGKNTFDLLPLSEKNSVFNNIQERLKVDSDYSYEEVITLQKNESTIYLSLKAGLINIDGEKYRCLRFTDISKDIIAKQKLQDSNEKYKHLLNSSREGIVIHDRGLAVEVSRRFCEILGRTESDIIGKPIMSFVTPEEAPKIIQFLRENEKNFDNVRHETTKALHSSGDILDIELWGNRIELEGNPYRYVVIRDITEENIARKNLEVSKKRYKLLSDITEEIVVVHDNGIIIEVNKAACDFFELSQDELVGKHTFDVLTTDTIKKHGLSKEVLENAYKSNKVNEGIYVKTKGDRTVYCKFKESLLFIDGRRLRYVVMRDITKEQEAKIELEKSHQKYKRLAGITNEMVIVHEMGKIIEVNNAACQYLGSTEEKLIGMHLFDLVTEEVKKELNLDREKLEQLLSNDRLKEGISSVYRNEKTYHIQFREDLFEDNGNVLRYLIVRDITQLRESQLMLEESSNKFKIFADATHEAISIYKDGLLKEANKAYCELFQLNPEEISGYKSVDLVLPKDRLFFSKSNKTLNQIIKKIDLSEISNKDLKEIIHYEMQQILYSEGVEFPYKMNENGYMVLPLRKKDGSTFMAEYFEDFLIKDGEIYQYQIIRDVTKTIDYQYKLEESNKKYKFFANATREGIIIHKDAEILEVNDAACRLFGLSEGELIGLGIKDFTENYGAVHQMNIENAGNLKTDRVLFNKSDGETFIAELWESDLVLDGQSVRYTVIRDMTDRIRYEQRIEELVLNLSERNKQLNCLLSLARLNSMNSKNTLDVILDEALNVIPLGWQFPETCGVCINYGNKERSSRTFQDNFESITAPIILENQQEGYIRVFYTEKCPPADEGPFSLAERTLIDAIGLQLSILIDKKLSDDRVLASVLETEERERARMAKELHDSLGQILIAVSLNLETVKKEIGALSPKSQNKFSNAVHYLGEAIEESRELAHSLMPKAIGDYGYVLAVHSIMERLGAEEIDVRFYNNLENERLPSNIELALFRITQEALTNIIKHSKASVVTIQLMKYSDMLILTVEDNGNGFNLNESVRHFGISSMRNRTNALSGIFTLESTEGNGTTIMIEIPL
jgi:PAS domain S-box-containing protein